MTGYGLIRGDALRLPLRDESVDAVITSPPYFALRSYQDDGEHYDGQIGSEDTPAGFLAALWVVMDECWRVLKPSGSCFVDLGDKYSGAGGPGGDYNPGGLKDGQPRYDASDYWSKMAPRNNGVPRKSLMGLPWRFALGCICPDDYRTLQADDYGAGLDGEHPTWTLRAEIVWAKPNGLPESVTDRVRRSHETWFHLTKGPRYYAAVDEIREAYTPTPHTSYTNIIPDRHSGAAGGHTGLRSVDPNPLGKLPGSVWTIPSEPLAVPDHLGVDHYAAFPQEWPRRLILGWTPSGICVKCGEGRRPVVDKRYRIIDTAADTRGDALSAQGLHNNAVASRPYGRADTEATITGYACACDVPIAPTRPAVVLDPFVGTGTVPMVARALGRYGVGVDLSRDYLRLARWRIGRSGHGAKSAARTNRERQGVLW